MLDTAVTDSYGEVIVWAGGEKEERPNRKDCTKCTFWSIFEYW